MIADVQLHLGDCLEILKVMPDGSVDAVITDPPYGTGTAEWDIDPSPEVWSQIRRVCPNGPIAVFGYARQLFKWARYFDGLNLIGFIVWYKPNEVVVSQGLTRVHQDIAIWGRSIRQCRAGEVREPYRFEPRLAKFFSSGGSDRMSKRIHESGRQMHPDGRRCTDLWEINAPYAHFNSHLRLHPNQKPIELMEKLVRLLSGENQVVLDPFMGSGTTGVACAQTGRGFVGIEIEPKYFEIAKERIRKAREAIQPALFE